MEKFEQGKLNFDGDNEYKLNPKTKADWDRILDEVKKRVYKEEEGAYWLIPGPEDSYWLRKWVYSKGSKPTLDAVELSSEEENEIYKISGLKKPRVKYPAFPSSYEDINGKKWSPHKNKF